MRHALRCTAVLVCFTLLIAQLPAGAWGSEGHMLINRVAAQKLPKSMPDFFAANADRLAWLGPEPDRWRNPHELALKRSQEPDHFFNTEDLPADFGALPADRYAFIHMLDDRHAAAIAAGMDKKVADRMLAEHIGLQPYEVMEIYGRLVVALREYRHAVTEKDVKRQANAQQNAIFYAGWMGHYVADASQPLHMSIHYDGWVGANPNGYHTERGIHSYFETKIVKDWNVQAKDIMPLVKEPSDLKDPWAAYQAYMKQTLEQVEPLYKLEKAGAFKDAGTADGHAYLNTRIAAGAQMLSNLWYTAWVDSATDPVDPFNQPKPATVSDTKKTAADTAAPDFIVNVSLSLKAKSRLADSKETVIVAAYISGNPKPSPKLDKKMCCGEGDNSGIATFRRELQGEGLAMFSGNVLPMERTKQMENDKYEVLINVFSGRRSSNGNLLYCDIYEGELDSIRNRTIPIACKLIGE